MPSMSQSPSSNAVPASSAMAGGNADPLIIGGQEFHSRLLIGTGKYRDFTETREAVQASGAQIVTVAIRRTNIGQNANEPSLLDALPPSAFTVSQCRIGLATKPKRAPRREPF